MITTILWTIFILSIWATTSYIAYKSVTKLERKEGRIPSKIFFIPWALLGPPALAVAAILWLIHYTEEKNRTKVDYNEMSQTVVDALEKEQLQTDMNNLVDEINQMADDNTKKDIIKENQSGKVVKEEVFVKDGKVVQNDITEENMLKDWVEKESTL
jgi:hypothetical protein